MQEGIPRKKSPWYVEPGSQRDHLEFKQTTLADLHRHIRDAAKQLGVVYEIEKNDLELIFRIEESEKEQLQNQAVELLQHTNALLESQEKPFRFELEDRGTAFIIRAIDT